MKESIENVERSNAVLQDLQLQTSQNLINQVAANETFEVVSQAVVQHLLANWLIKKLKE